VGQEITYTIKRPPFNLKWSVAVVLLLALVGSAGQLKEIPGGTVPEVFVTLDINPSIELALNCEQRVVRAEGLNAEGKSLVGKLSLLGSTFRQAVKDIGAQAESDGYLTPGKNEIVVTISQKGIKKCEPVQPKGAPAGGSSSEQEIEAVINETLAAAYQVKMWRVPGEIREKIREAGLTPAKYIAVHVELESSTTASAGGSGAAVPVSATVERSGDHHYFEFEVTRPVFPAGMYMRTSGQE